ncbi:MAG: type II CAAX endopeptidase family protein [Clostridia bacterium]
MYNYDEKQQKNAFANEIVLDQKHGYITRKKLAKKAISSETNWLNFAMIFFFVGSLLTSLMMNFLSMFLSVQNYQVLFLSEYYYAWTGIASFMSLALPFFIYIKAKGEKISDLLCFEKTKSYGALFVLAGLGCCYFINIPVNILTELFYQMGYQVTSQSIDVPYTISGIIILYFSVAIVPALVEEFVLRGIFLKKLQRFGNAFAIIISSLIFSLLHMDLMVIIVTFVAGLVMGFIYVKTKNLWYSVIIHFLNNFFSVTMTIVYSYYGDSDFGLFIQLILFYTPIVLGLIAFIILIMKKQINLPKNNAYGFIGAGTKFSAAILNPCTIVLVLTCLTIAIMSVAAI